MYSGWIIHMVLECSDTDKHSKKSQKNKPTILCFRWSETLHKSMVNNSHGSRSWNAGPSQTDKLSWTVGRPIDWLYHGAGSRIHSISSLWYRVQDLLSNTWTGFPCLSSSTIAILNKGIHCIKWNETNKRIYIALPSFFFFVWLSAE